MLTPPAGHVQPATSRASGTPTRRLLTPLEAIECDAIVEALLDTNGNKTGAARLLGSSRGTVDRRIREYGSSMADPVSPAAPGLVVGRGRRAIAVRPSRGNGPNGPARPLVSGAGSPCPTQAMNERTSR